MTGTILVTVEDIAWFAADIFLNPDLYRDRVVDIASDSLTVDEMKRVYESVYGRKAPRLPLPFSLMKLGNPEMGRQLDWNNKQGWHFDLQPLRERHPALTSFRRFLENRRQAQHA